ncbi:hypothetical protein Tcan_07022 [Toxocara canis]|uniref:Ground-like domain-containing protein n=1 Tax=Toxocara canis TaxID=6265 RepID=A0A0B2VYQ7_TOXCA|nr:hypothetical protein Tcan_07022 [Toxocara canis]
MHTCQSMLYFKILSLSYNIRDREVSVHSGIKHKETESEWQQQETFNETPQSSGDSSAPSQTEEELNVAEEHTVPPFQQTIVPASTVVEPNWDDNNEDNHDKHESGTNEETEEELVSEAPFPFSHCYMNINGFMCCNRSLELQMRRTYRRLRHSTPSYTSCNIQKLANLIQRDVERKFSTQFEAIVALDDFVVHSHFVSDLTCKIEIDGRYIAVYASHNSSVDETVAVPDLIVPGWRPGGYNVNGSLNRFVM